MIRLALHWFSPWSRVMKKVKYITFEILAAVNIKITVLEDVIPCILVCSFLSAWDHTWRIRNLKTNIYLDIIEWYMQVTAVMLSQMTHYFIQGVPVRKIIILVGHSIGHSKQKQCVCTCVLFRTVSEIELLHCTIPHLFIRKRYYVR
jgi:hypothetical protein